LQRFQGTQGNVQYHSGGGHLLLPSSSLFFVAQRFFVQGIVMSGIKG
jgi:ABC-type maltose transport system permease subunit